MEPSNKENPVRFFYKASFLGSMLNFGDVATFTKKNLLNVGKYTMDHGSHGV